MDMDTTLPEMIPVVDIQFKSGGKCYFFDPGELELNAGDEVIIDTQRGLEFGVCQRSNHNVMSTQVVQPLRPVVRLASDADRQRLKDNEEREKEAFDTCQRLIERLALDMKLVRVECAFDGSKLLFFFTSDGRVDFRELVKELAAVYRTRIEMRQIGVRDEAKLLGGLGICGRPFCCAQFLDDFQPVSIKMAKTQSLSLNPTKISGTCGRLMCCLKYEQDAYEDLLKTCPRQGSLVDTVDGRGTVLETSLLRQQVKVGLEDSPDTVKYYPNEEIAVLRDGKGKKTDPPIPKEVAPISGDPERKAYLLRSKSEESERLPELIYTSGVEEPEPIRRRRLEKREKTGGTELPVGSAKTEKPEQSETGGHPHNHRRRPAKREPLEQQEQPNRQHRPKPTGEAEGAPHPNGYRRRSHRGGRGHGGQKPPATGAEG